MMSNSDYNEEKYGKKIEYDPLWKGPMQTVRTPTDRIWLIVFGVYLAIYIIAASYGFIAGDVGKLLAPKDRNGQYCGVDTKVRDKPYLLIFDLRECLSIDTCKLTQSSCVSKCPIDNFDYRDSSNMPLEDRKKAVYCISEIDKNSITSVSQLDGLIETKQCTQWFLKSEPLYRRCLPSEVWQGHEQNTISNHQLSQIKSVIYDAELFISKALSDMKAAAGPSVTAIVFGGILALGYVILLKWFAIPFFYASICMFLAALGYGIYLLINLYIHTQADARTKDASIKVLLLLIFAVLLMVGVIVAVIYFRKKIYLACQLIKESSKAVLHMSSTLVFPLLPGLLYLIVIVFSGLALFSLSTVTVSRYAILKQDIHSLNEKCSCPNYSPSLEIGSTCNPDVFLEKCKSVDQLCNLECGLMRKDSPGYIYVFYFIIGVGFYWLVFFINGFEYMVLGGTFGSWYWTHHKQTVGNYSLIESIVRTLRYHLGTLALGSLILTIIQIVRALLKNAQKKLQDAEHPVAAIAMSCFRCCFDMIAAFIEFLNYNAYIMCAIHGKSFCTSAKNAFHLLMRNIMKVVVVDNVADLLFAMAKLLITSIAVGSVLLYYQGRGRPEPEMFTALWMTGIGTLIISSVFFSVQNIAVKTIFLSFIEDSERHDGSDERPYYMSKKLEKLLQK